MLSIALSPFAAIISDILSCRVFLITTRLAYAVYLTQFPIFFYNVGRTRHSDYYNFITSTVTLPCPSPPIPFNSLMASSLKLKIFKIQTKFNVSVNSISGKFVWNWFHNRDISYFNAYVRHTIPKYQESFVETKTNRCGHKRTATSFGT